MCMRVSCAIKGHIYRVYTSGNTAIYGFLEGRRYMQCILPDSTLAQPGPYRFVSIYERYVYTFQMLCTLGRTPSYGDLVRVRVLQMLPTPQGPSAHLLLRRSGRALQRCARAEGGGWPSSGTQKEATKLAHAVVGNSHPCLADSHQCLGHSSYRCC